MIAQIEELKLFQISEMLVLSSIYVSPLSMRQFVTRHYVTFSFVHRFDARASHQPITTKRYPSFACAGVSTNHMSYQSPIFSNLQSHHLGNGFRYFSSHAAIDI